MARRVLRETAVPLGVLTPAHRDEYAELDLEGPGDAVPFCEQRCLCARLP